MAWQSILEQVLQLTYNSLAQDDIRWAIIGSVASALQGCQINPNDIDFLAARPEGVSAFAKLMSIYTPPTCVYTPDDKNWYSSQELAIQTGPGPIGFVRYMGRWYVEGFKVEMAHLAAIEENSLRRDGILEFGPDIWSFVRYTPFAGYQVPVVPLEIQLETTLSRGLEDRLEEIMMVFREKGYDQALVEQSLSYAHLRIFERLRQKQSKKRL